MKRAMMLCAAAFLAGAQGWAQGGGSLSGRVVSTLHDEPVAGAQVTLRGLDGEKPQTYLTQTDAQGRFSIHNIVPGTYEPRPSKTGYEQRTPDHFATAADFPPITISAGAAAEPVVLRLIPDGVIAGRVIDSDGDPVRRALVDIQRYQYVAGKKQLQSVRSAQTDDRGQYRLFHLPPGKYYLHVEPQQGMAMAVAGGFASRQDGAGNGLGPVFYPESPDALHATQLDLAPGAEIDGVDIRLTQTRLYSVRGKMGITPGENGWNIFVQPLNGPFRGNFPTYYENGDYIARNLPPGKYVINGQLFPPRKNSDGSAQGEGSNKYAREVIEIVDRDLDHVDLNFAPAVKITGLIKTEGGATFQSVNGVSFIPVNDGFVQQAGNAQVKKDGTFTTELAPCVCRVRAFGPKIYVKSVLVGNEPAPDRTIDTSRLSGNITVVVSDGFGKVEGKVLDENAKPVYNADVTLIPDQSRPDWQERFRSVLTKYDGSFTFSNLEPGEYRAYAWLAVEQGAPQDAEFRKPYDARAVDVKVAPGSSQTVELKVIQPH